jgi:hypothetical protein
MSLSVEDAKAIAGTAQRLGVDPRTLGGLMELESGVDPNIWGGAGGKYRGLIQFGPGARQEVGLPDGPMTIAQQMPYVEKYFQQRGFQPGKHGPTELYRTVLVGNPSQSGTDSFGTNSDKAAARMRPGGDLYQRFSAKFDPVLGGASPSAGATTPPRAPAAVAPPSRPMDPLAAALLASLQLPGLTTGGERKAGERLPQLLGGKRNPGGDAFQELDSSLGEVKNLGSLLAASLNGKPAAAAAVAPAAAALTGAAPGDQTAAPATGGFKVLEYLTGDRNHPGYRPDHGDQNYHEHIAMESPEQARAAAALLNQHGIKTTELKGVNSVGGHSQRSYHYSGMAFDVPASQVPVGQEQALSAKVRRILKIG